MRLTLLISIVCLLQTILKAQQGHYTLGARSAGFASASVAIEDEWAIFNNPAGINKTESGTALFGYRSRFAVAAFNTMGAAYLQPIGPIHLGMNAFRFGDHLFSEQKIGMVVANRIGMVALGGAINYIQYNVEGLGTRDLAAFDFGGVVTFMEGLALGAFVSNLNQASVSKSEGEKLPTIMRLGLTYAPVSSVLINGEIEKDLDFDEVIKLGVEYNFYKQFYARTGFLTQPFQSSFGLGFRPRRYMIDYAFGHDPGLGSIHEFSVSYRLKMER